jgi:hypothetical protein
METNTGAQPDRPRSRGRTDDAGHKSAPRDDGSAMLDVLIDQLVEPVAEKVAASLVGRAIIETTGRDEWFDSRHAAEDLGVHRDTLRRLAAERAIPSEQDGPGCKLYFRRSHRRWRRLGGRPRHLASTLSGIP